MRFKIVPQNLEVDDLVLPYADHITFRVRRLGYGPYQDYERERNGTTARRAKKAAMEASKAVSLVDLASVASEERQEAAQRAFIEAYERALNDQAITEEVVELALDENREGIALLVESVKGLEDEDRGGPVEWSPEVAAELFQCYPVIRLAILEKAGQLEVAFQSYVAGAGKNSPAPSATSEPVAEGATN